MNSKDRYQESMKKSFKQREVAQQYTTARHSQMYANSSMTPSDYANSSMMTQQLCLTPPRCSCLLMESCDGHLVGSRVSWCPQHPIETQRTYQSTKHTVSCHDSLQCSLIHLCVFGLCCIKWFCDLSINLRAFMQCYEVQC